MRIGRQTLSAGLHNRPVCRAGTHTPGKLNHVSAAIRRPLPCVSSAAPEAVSPGLGRTFLNGAAVDRALNFSVHDPEFGDQAADGVSKWLPCVGSLHADKHGVIDGQAAAKNRQGVACVYS